MTTIEWFSGVDDYRKHTLTYDAKKKVSEFTIELLDKPSLDQDWIKVISDRRAMDHILTRHVESAKRPVEVLFSGGLDSESVMYSLLVNKIPTRAITGRWLFKGKVINDQDVFYATRFCQQHWIPQTLIDLDIDKFFYNGDHLPYLDPYRITTFNAAPLFWLIEQCKTFPIIGGDYTWPYLTSDVRVYKPHRSSYNCFDHFMRSKGIPGIGNMLSHSLESNLMFIHAHKKLSGRVYEKHDIFFELGFDTLDRRPRSHGWEYVLNQDSRFDWKIVSTFLVQRYGPTKNVIKWGNSMAQAIDSTDKFNDKS